jgi:hypothetical protein
VTGQGWVASAGTVAPITVRGSDDNKGAFTFYFSAVPQKD